jgi:hypothetical protein
MCRDDQADEEQHMRMNEDIFRIEYIRKKERPSRLAKRVPDLPHLSGDYKHAREQ